MLACIHGGQVFKSRPKDGSRPEDKQALEVKEMMLDHSHDVNPKVFMNIPQQRKVDKNVSNIFTLKKKKYIYMYTYTY